MTKEINCPHCKKPLIVSKAALKYNLTHRIGICNNQECDFFGIERSISEKYWK